MNALHRTIAEGLLKIGAVRFSPSKPFTWSSGMKSPVYCDNRISLSNVTLRGHIAEAFSLEAASQAGRFDGVSGTATAGIPYATLLADRMELPLTYVRGEAKGHGRQNRVEGMIEEGDQVLLVEDLVSTGQSVLSAAEALRALGASVPVAFSVVTYDLQKSRQAFEEAGIPLVSLLTFADLLTVAEAGDRLSEGEVRSIRRWHSDPAEWSRQKNRRNA